MNLVLMGASTASLAIDWMQTRTIAKNPDRWYETNVVLGKHPSVDKVDIYFASVIAANIGLHWILPRDWQPYWYGAITSIELGYAAHNFTLGVGF